MNRIRHEFKRVVLRAYRHIDLADCAWTFTRANNALYAYPEYELNCSIRLLDELSQSVVINRLLYEP